MPVNTMAIPALSAAAITSLSRTEPPGWITAVAPAAMAASSPSAKGKKASEATTEPLARAPEAGGLGRFLGLQRGDARGCRRGSSGRRRCRPWRRPSHRRWRSTSRAWRRGRRRADPAISRSVGARLVTTFRSPSPIAAGVARLHEEARRRPMRSVMPGAAGSGRPPASSRRRFFFPPSTAFAPSVGLGRDDHLGEDARRSPRPRRIERPVDRDDAAEGADRIAAQRLVVGIARDRCRPPRRRDWRA